MHMHAKLRLSVVFLHLFCQTEDARRDVRRETGMAASLVASDESSAERGPVLADVFRLLSLGEHGLGIGALSKIEQLRPVTFDWVTDGVSSQGLIAQEVHSVLPELREDLTKDFGAGYDVENPTYPDGSKYVYMLDYSRFVPYLIAAVQELSARVRVLESAQNNAAA